MAKHDTKKNARRPEPAKSEPISASAAEPAKDSPIDARLAIPLDSEGRVLLDNMRESSREKLKELLSNRDLATKLGIGAAESASAPSMALPPQLMYPLISGLSIFEVLIVAKATNAPRDIVERVVPYSRDEAMLLAPALAGVLEKYSGQFLVKYQEEAALAALLVSMTVNKIALVREEMDKRGPATIIPMRPVSSEPEPPASPLEPQS